MSLPMADNEKGVFVVISDIELKKETLQEFKEWFVESNKVVSAFDGYISRRLLESPEGAHKIIVIFRDKEAFSNMRQSQVHAGIHSKAIQFMERPPRPAFFSVIAE